MLPLKHQFKQNDIFHVNIIDKCNDYDCLPVSFPFTLFLAFVMGQWQQLSKSISLLWNNWSVWTHDLVMKLKFSIHCWERWFFCLLEDKICSSWDLVLFYPTFYHDWHKAVNQIYINEVGMKTIGA